MSNLGPEIEFPSWEELEAKASKATRAEWEAYCRNLGERASEGLIKWDTPNVREALALAMAEDKEADSDRNIWQAQNQQTTGHGEVYGGKTYGRKRVALAWIILHDQQLAAWSVEPWKEPWDFFCEGTKCRVAELIKCGVRWCGQEWELIYEWTKHPVSPDIWWSEWYYRHPPAGDAELKKLAARVMRRTAPYVPAEVLMEAYDEDAVELHEVMGQVLRPRDLLYVIRSAKISGGAIGKTPSLVLTPEWWASLSREEQVEALTDPNKDSRELIVAVLGRAGLVQAEEVRKSGVTR